MRVNLQKVAATDTQILNANHSLAVLICDIKLFQCSQNSHEDGNVGC